MFSVPVAIAKSFERRQLPHMCLAGENQLASRVLAECFRSSKWRPGIKRKAKTKGYRADQWLSLGRLPVLFRTSQLGRRGTEALWFARE